MHALVLGRGFLGTRIHRRLNNEEGFSSDIFSRKEFDYTNLNVLYGKISAGWVEMPDVIINASGYTGVPNIDAAEDDRESCWYNNVMVPITICKVADMLRIPMVHVSSGCIYTGYEKAWAESDIPNFGMFNQESSFYSKTKHVAEMMLENHMCWMFRIRMPFCGEDVARNYFNKILSYDNLISMRNSVTSVDDFCDFLVKFLSSNMPLPYTAYNVVNEGNIEARKIIEIMSEYDLINPNHKFIPLDELDTKAKRSNCILSTDLLKVLKLSLPPVEDSVRKAVKQLAEEKELWLEKG